MVCNAKPAVTSSTSYQQARRATERFILSTAESSRLRSYLLDYVETTDPNHLSEEDTFVIRIAHIAAQYRRLILTTDELKQIERLLSFRPTTKEQI